MGYEERGSRPGPSLPSSSTSQSTIRRSPRSASPVRSSTVTAATCSRSVYAPQLQRWADRWATPPIVLGFRELLADPTSALDRVLEPIGRRSVRDLHAPRSNAGTAREQVDPGVLADVRAVLDRFTPAIEELAPGISDRW